MSGEILTILAVMVFVISNAMFRRVETTISPMKINAFRTTIGGMTFFLIILISGLTSFYAVFPALLWIILFLSIFFGQVLGDTFYFFTQERLGTTKALAVAMIFPFFTFIISTILLGTSIPLR
ncbi:MAG: EamA family transporter [Candidatus Hodarchaeales archaeon]